MTSVDLHCPSCQALVKAGADWCTLCYADLRPAPAPESEPALASGGSAPALHADQPGSPLAAGPAGGPGGAEPTEEQRREIEDVANRMLAQLAAESSVPLASVSGHFQSNGAKVALIFGGTIVLVGVILGLMTLIG